MTPRQSRLLRAAAASGIATTLAAVSHTLGGGLPPHPLLVVAVAVLTIPVSAALIGRRPSRMRTALTVTAAQLAFHLLFHYLGGSIRPGDGYVGHVHEVILGPVASVAAPDALMLLAHAIAAAATTVLLWHGERMLRRIAAWARAALRAAPVLPDPQHPSLPAPIVIAAVPRRRADRSTAVLRGPPSR